ncbi:MAG: anti-sigma factor domain-containing protein [Nocardioidaceae bacterium]
MSDIHALSGAYAVDALDDLERAHFQRHLSECAECRAEVASFRETAALLTAVEENTAPESLRAGVLAGIAKVRPLPPDGPAVARARAAGRHVVARRTLPTLVAAAVAVLLLAAGAVAWHPWNTGTASLADRVLHAPDAVRITEKLPGGNGELTLVRSVSLKRAVMIGEHVPEPEPGTTYQLWLDQPGAGMVSAGLMPDSTEPTVLTGDAATATAVAMTVEPGTGSAHPTSQPLVVFALKGPSKDST